MLYIFVLGETDNYLTQFETVAEEENVTIGEDYLDESVSLIFDEVTGICDSTADENNESKFFFLFLKFFFFS